MKPQNKLKAFYNVLLALLIFTGFEAVSQSGREFYRTPYNSRNSGSFDKGTNLLSLGYGVPNFLYSGYGVSNSFATGSASHIGIGPLMLKYEFAIRDEVGLGLIVQGASKSWKYRSGSATYVDNAWGIGTAFMGYYHFNKLIPVEKLDVYAGLGLNLTYQQLNRDRAYYDDYYTYYGYYTDQVRSEFMARPCGLVGVRYYVAPKFAFSAEAGYSTFSSINLGFTFRL